YVVRNELGNTLFKRSQQEDEPAERDRFLREAVEQFEKTLQTEPEDLDAHYGLAQCFGRLGAAAPAGVALGNRPEPNRPYLAALTAWAGDFANAHTPREQRVQAAVELARALPRLGDLPTDVSQ